jgi:hypothetical protein
MSRSIKILVKKKFNLLFKQYKMDKLAIDVSRDEKHINASFLSPLINGETKCVPY